MAHIITAMVVLSEELTLVEKNMTIMSKPWWFPELVDAAFIERFRKVCPENSHLDDEEFRSTYECESKYAITWDHIGDAYDEYEKLADHVIELREELQTKIDQCLEAGWHPETVEHAQNLINFKEE